jgi:hypothetical protein
VALRSHDQNGTLSNIRTHYSLLGLARLLEVNRLDQWVDILEVGESQCLLIVYYRAGECTGDHAGTEDQMFCVHRKRLVGYGDHDQLPPR